MNNEDNSGQGDNRQRWLPLLLIAGAAFLVFANTLPNGLTLDDVALVENNPLVQQLTPLHRYLSSSWWSGQQGYGDALYRPLTLFSFGLQHAVHGTAPFGYHLVNLLLYSLCLLPVYGLLARLFGCRRAALWGSLVFALHAVHCETVAGVVGRAELLAFLFGATALLLHARAYELPRVGRWGGLILALVCLFCAGASKESGLAWLAALVLWDLAAPDRDGAIGQRLLTGIRAWGWYLIPTAGYLLLRAWALSASAGPSTVYYPVNPLAWSDTTVRVLTGIKLLLCQQLLILFPFRLVSDYSFDSIGLVHSVADPWFLAALAAHTAVAAGAILAWRRSRPLFFAIAFFYATAAITSNIPLPIGTIFGERLLFTPSLSLAVAAAWFLQRRKALERRQIHLLGLVALWLAASAVTAMGRGPEWRNNRTLFLADVERQPKSVVLNLRAASIRLDEGDTAEAERLLLRARGLLPGDPVVLNNLGELYRLTGRPVEAEASLREAYQAAAGPRWSSVARNRALPSYNLGLLRIAEGRPDQALPWLEQATALDPGNLDARDTLLQAGLSTLPEERFRRLLADAEAAYPGHPLWRYYRGLFALARQGRAAEAEAHLATALAADPGEIRFHIALADLKAQTGRFAESATIYRRVLKSFQLQPEQAAEITNRLRMLENGMPGR